MKQRVEAEIDRLVTIFVKDQASDGSWSYPFETGISTDCYMIILLRTLEINDEELIQSLVDRIVSKQGENGSWKLFYDEDDGNITATVWNTALASYALQEAGVRLSSKVAKRGTRTTGIGRRLQKVSKAKNRGGACLWTNQTQSGI